MEVDMVELPELKALVQQKAQPEVDSMLRSLKREVQRQNAEAQQDREVKIEELQRILEEVKRKFDMLNKYLKIDIDKDLEIPVVRIIERETNKVLRQIPPDYLLELMKRIDQLLGLLVEKEV